MSRTKAKRPRIPQKTSNRQLLSMVMTIALPVALQNVLTTTGSMVDTMMLGTIGQNTVGAVGLCAQFSSLLFSGFWGFVGGGMLFFAQYWGAGNDEGILRSYGIMLAFMAIPATVFSSLALGAPYFVMRIYTSSVPIQEIGVRYLRVVGFSYPLMVLATAMSALLRSTERVKIPLAGGIAAVITNFVCNYILIFGKLGFPALGVVGAAIGTVIANAVNVLVIAALCIRQREPYVLKITRHWHLNRELLAEYLRKSAPIIANEVMIGVGNMMINIVLGHQIEDAIAATAVFRTLEGMIIGFFSGFSSAATVLVGKEVGAGCHEEAFSRAWRIVYFCSFITLLACLFLVGIHTPLFHAMGLHGAAFDFAFGMLLIFTIIGPVRMGNWTQNDTYRSAGDSAFGSTLEILFMFAMVQPVIHLANDVFHAPFLLVFALCYVDEPIRYFLMQRHMYSLKWIRPVSSEGRRTLAAFREKYHIS